MREAVLIGMVLMLIALALTWAGDEQQRAERRRARRMAKQPEISGPWRGDGSPPPSR